jgi:hypothetical protein
LGDSIDRIGDVLHKKEEQEAEAKSIRKVSKFEGIFWEGITMTM